MTISIAVTSVTAAGSYPLAPLAVRGTVPYCLRCEAFRPAPRPQSEDRTMIVTRNALLAAVLTTACSGGNAITTPADNGGGGTNGSSVGITATLFGAPWSSQASHRASMSNNLMVVTGTCLDNVTISLDARNVAATGTYPLGYGNAAGGSVEFVMGNRGWTSELPGGQGEMTVTSLTATHVEGTFSFIVVPRFASTSPADTIRVSDGKFDMDIQ